MGRQTAILCNTLKAKERVMVAPTTFPRCRTLSLSPETPHKLYVCDMGL